MEAKAHARNLRISALKVRKVIQIVKGKKVDEALAVLKVLPQKSAAMIYKALYSARANFMQQFPEADTEKLVISSIFANEGPVFRRMLPRARGRADILRKQTAHLTVVVSIPEAGE